MGSSVLIVIPDSDDEDERRISQEKAAVMKAEAVKAHATMSSSVIIVIPDSDDEDERRISKEKDAVMKVKREAVDAEAGSSKRLAAIMKEEAVKAPAKKVKREADDAVAGSSRKVAGSSRKEDGARKVANLRQIAGTDPVRHTQILMDMVRNGMDSDMAEYLLSKKEEYAAADMKNKQVEHVRYMFIV